LRECATRVWAKNLIPVFFMAKKNLHGMLPILRSA